MAWSVHSLARRQSKPKQQNERIYRKKKIKILASLQNFFWLKNGLSTLYCVYNHLTMLYKHLSRKSLQHDRSEQQTITDIKEQFFSEKWFHRKKKKKALSHFSMLFLFVFFSWEPTSKKYEVCVLSPSSHSWSSCSRSGCYHFCSLAIRTSSAANGLLVTLLQSQGCTSVAKGRLLIQYSCCRCYQCSIGLEHLYP